MTCCVTLRKSSSVSEPLFHLLSNEHNNISQICPENRSNGSEQIWSLFHSSIPSCRVELNRCPGHVLDCWGWWQSTGKRRCFSLESDSWFGFTTSSPKWPRFCSKPSTGGNEESLLLYHPVIWQEATVYLRERCGCNGLWPGLWDKLGLELRK